MVATSDAPPPLPRRFIGRRTAQERTAESAAPAAEDGSQHGGAQPVGRPDGPGQHVAGVSGSGGQVVVAARPSAPKRFVRQQVPDEILHDAALNEAIGVLPANYNFEIHKSVWRLRQVGARRVALQFPEGLLMYSCIISDILEAFAGVEQCFIMGDVTYGACCVDDFSAAALRCDFLLHYGHSCLVPVDVTGVPSMYVFVDIGIDVAHLADSVRLNFELGARLALAGTIQFAGSIQAAKAMLEGDFPSLAVPQSRPLSPGEVLGCTAPVLAAATDAIVFVADGRFHLEAIMIANPAIPAYRYDPYERKLTTETYDQAGMRAARRAAVEAAVPARRWGLVLGTLGRQGNPRILEHLRGVVERRGLQHTLVLLSEVTPQKLELMNASVDAWCQVACPRLSIDWGEAFKVPTLTPFEALVALGETDPWWAPGTRLASAPGMTSSVCRASPAAPPSSQQAPGGEPKPEVGSRPADTAPSAASSDGQQVGGAPAAEAAAGLQRAAVPVECSPLPAGQRPQFDEHRTPSDGGADPYPMDYYARDGGVWGSSYHRKSQPQSRREPVRRTVMVPV